MPDREVLKHHAGLVDRMATKLGVDLQQSAIDGDVSIDQLSDAVLRCTGCANPSHCQNFLRQPAQARQTPEYCRNRDLLRKLLP
ncbi:hypothetical protein RUE5091_00294 [Ruegeria denitrificans]|uniref:DUF6455 domain-containing protein n=1 Tax=Ruegeria denitrificans TaxID=1715692 RepID=A0A0P1I1Z2_9RHOB|nr:DUF6455 family protein [Ruegeria denitrificans]CUJ85072.1 hypothetical protein RUE5091_00294 [Ruegeria denitrificans]